VELGAAVREALVGVQEEMRRSLPRGVVRWVRPENTHLTLRFLGDTPAAKVGDVVEALRVVTGGCRSTVLEVGGLGCFPDARRPLVVWVGAREPAGTLRLRVLQGAVEEAMRGLGFPAEAKPFHPHLTLGRVDRGARPQQRAALQEALDRVDATSLGTMSVDHLCLVRSQLGAGGPVYSCVARHGLAPPVDF
jgi:2'-5' RNA ligase